ncbi:hemin uptake protein HemP [Jannaschia sp.]|nr:hemin uptake protein HemP [Jannaschia sp.]
MNMADATRSDTDVEPIHRVEDILCGATTAKIVLGNQAYTLRLTRAGKLILTK